MLAWWRKARVKGLVIGGLAVALLGRARTTRDVDAIVFVDEEHWISFLRAGQTFSFLPRLPTALEFARTNRVLLLHHQRSDTDVDLSIGSLEFEKKALGRAHNVRVGRLSVPVATVEDLIVLKAVANRPQDWTDIEALLEGSDSIDEDYVREHVDEFASLLEQPMIYQHLDSILRRQKRRRRK
jgi:hypothetical protein